MHVVLCLEVVFAYIIQVTPGLHKLCHPTIRDSSTWSKFGARGEHGDVFLSSQVKNSLFSFRHFLVTVLKILTYALVSTWSLVSSQWEHVKRKMHPWVTLTMTDGLWNVQICWGPFKKRMCFYNPNWVWLLSSCVTRSLYLIDEDNNFSLFMFLMILMLALGQETA